MDIFSQENLRVYSMDISHEENWNICCTQWRKMEYILWIRNLPLEVQNGDDCGIHGHLTL